MSLKSSHVYASDLCTIKRYGDMYKLTCLEVCKVPGWQLVNCEVDLSDVAQNEWSDGVEVVKRVGQKKLDNNLSRAKSAVLEYGMCNNWDYFCTLTLNKEKYDRSDLAKYIKDLGQFIRDKRKAGEYSLRYVLIPELHKDGESWHLHGLIGGLPRDKLSFFIPGVHPVKLCNGSFLNWPDYANKFGFVSLGVIRNNMAVSLYITKYIKKSLGEALEFNKKSYYCSRGLNKSELIKKGHIKNDMTVEWDYVGRYAKCKWFKELKDINNIINDCTI